MALVEETSRETHSCCNHPTVVCPRIYIGQQSASHWSNLATIVFGNIASVGIALFPKCPVCWSAYLSFFGIAGLEKIPYAPWLIPLLAVLMLISLVSAGIRATATRRYWPVLLVALGIAVILICKVGLGWDRASLPGLVLTLVGSLAGVMTRRRDQKTTTARGQV